MNAFLLLAWRCFSYKKTFSEQYTPLNNRIQGVLVEDFYESVSNWAKENKKRGREVELNELMQSLGDLFAKSRKLSRWNDHITHGKEQLREASSALAIGGVLLAIAVLAYAAFAEVESVFGVIAGFTIGYVSSIYLTSGVRAWREVCRIESEIDKYYSDLSLGKSLIIDNDEDEDAGV